MSKTLSTHVLDATTGTPAAGVRVELRDRDGATVTTAETDSDGRIPELAPGGLTAGHYTLTFDTGTYFETTGQENFYPEVTVTFRVDDTARGYHVPLLLSPFAYSTYRGS
ncbi:hydroxyisourate hydrolase [Rhodococcus erythropolis]|uniref:hydroxyisourate hydrolase n=1 Tax=Rhodococcus erythropolis TaxID=1833 RepID=UPI001BE94BED|nr:hydroxyisourate hydrolase [Rhodococcus erythropolis]MBT2266817.1 hydroxyisourate hydrolase [Rhodococcus erythropolis]